jgi:VWFA-related protein
MTGGTMKASATFRRVGRLAAAVFLLCAALAPAPGLGQDSPGRPRRVDQQQAQPPRGETPPPAADGDDELELRSDLVSLTVSVTDAAGRAVTGLKPEDFRVLENGQPQKVTHFELTGEPYTMLLVIDVSGSTTNQLEGLRSGAAQFVRGLGAEDRLGIIVFSRGIDLLGDPTDDRAELGRQVSSISSSAGRKGKSLKFSELTGTSFYDAVYLACVESPLAELKGEGRRAVIVLSDCVDSSSAYTFDSMLEAVERSGIAVYTLEFDTQAYSDNLLTRPTGDSSRVNFSQSQLERFYDVFYPTSSDRGRNPLTYTTLERLEINKGLYEIAHAEAQRLAERTGGRTYRVASIADLPKAYQAITAELRTRYSIGYYPSNDKHDGTWRGLKVEVPRAPGASVVCRPGYWAPKN